MALIIIIIAIIIICVIAAAYHAHATRNKCEVCGEWNRIKILSKELISKEPTYMTVTKTKQRRTDYGKWHTIEERDRVDAIKETYHIKAICEKCGAPKEYSESYTYEDKRRR